MDPILDLHRRDTTQPSPEAFLSRFPDPFVQYLDDGPARDPRKALLLLICSNLTLRDGELAPVLREPYASLAKMPIAGDGGDFPSEPRQVAAASQKVMKSVSWLRLLTAIRTYTLPVEARRFVA